MGNYAPHRPARNGGNSCLKSLAFHDGVRHVAFTGLELATPSGAIQAPRPHGAGDRNTASAGYKTGTSARARAGTRVHRSRRETAQIPARTCPRVPARGRPSPSRRSLVMKGSRFESGRRLFGRFPGLFVGSGNLLPDRARFCAAFGYETGTSRTLSQVMKWSPLGEGFMPFAGDSFPCGQHRCVVSFARKCPRDPRPSS